MRVMRAHTTLVLAMAISFLGWACGGSSAEGDPSGGEASSGDGGETTGGEAASVSGDAAAGQRTYDQICGTCHGPGGAEGDLGPAITGEPRSVDRMRDQIRNGSGRMRPISPDRLSDADLPNLMAYLASIGAIE